MNRPASLPDFDNPPVVEVALSVQFERLSQLRSAHLGLFWRDLGVGFPRVEEHGPLDAAMEQFPDIPQAPIFNLRVAPGIPTPRVWFLDASGNELIQIQQDRFVHNWRKVGERDQYPRYERIRSRFVDELQSFERFLAEYDLGKLTPNQCEVTYVNHIELGEGWERFGQIDNVLKMLQSPDYAFLPEPEDVRLGVRYVMEDMANPIGRLYMSLEPRLTAESSRPILYLSLTARGRPQSPDLDSALLFMDRGREWIVRGFADITTASMHAAWGRRE
ncbi:MAG: TIGR04255 family protein [Dehalococcoidia bacterium]|nr:TIGR04255 family protein [Dehalococcoidia bacterium]